MFGFNMSVVVRYATLVLVCYATTARGQEPIHPDPAKRVRHNTQLVLLGTGTPNPDPERSGPAVAIVVNDTPYLIDCGPGIVRRAEAAHLAGIAGLEMSRLSRLFVTHLHSDHTLGYPDLIFSPWVLGRTEPLSVYGPPGIKSMTEHILAAYAQDVHVRIDGLEPANTTGHKVNVTEIGVGQIYADDNVKVTAFAAPHGAWKHAFGFRFESADRTIVISGDTTPNPALIEAAKGCDVLLHEVYSFSALAKRNPAWQGYHKSAHTSTRELAEIANQVRPKLLVLYHQLYWGATDEDLVAEIRQTYKGRVVSGNDLDVF